MISFDSSLNLIQKSVRKSLKSEFIDINESFGRILTSDLYSKCDYPRENLSSMDGAVIFKSDLKLKEIEIVGEIKAGDSFTYDFNKGQSKLIFTGGIVPGKNKVIIPKEQFLISKNKLIIKDRKIQNFIRIKGSDFKKKELCLSKNTKMNCRTIALAAAMRINKIEVIKKPNVIVIMTGDELISSDKENPLVISTNQIMIKKIVNDFGGNLKDIYIVKDKIEDLEKLIKKLRDFDILITSGGISRGKYDLVKKVLCNLKMKILFDRVSIKPGKPTTFGKFSKNRYFLGLPGNPVSCFTSLVFFFSKFINCFYGSDYLKITKTKLILNNNLKTNKHLTLFLRIKKIKNKPNFFNVFSKQDSAQMKILSESNGILIRKPYEKNLIKGTECNVLLYENIFNNHI
ncbi:molybdopterin molybdotransferase MoeA [Alphaproteobacteria bacterium]|nr:molybdopterin molybdotransferase MoeA [Alphaproteobacteria bacterium]